MTRFLSQFMVVLALSAACLVIQAEMTIREEQEDQTIYPLKYNRFGGGGSQFIGTGVDWSGVGREVNTLTNSSRWGTLISSTFYVSANHWAPASGRDLIFYKGNTTQNAQQRTIGTSQWLAGSYDLRLGRLTNPVSSDIAVYPIFLKATTTQYIGIDFYMFGIAGSDPKLTTGQKVGRNTVHSVSTTTNSFNYRFDQGILDHEAMARLYDSGGPSFITTNVAGFTRPAVLGIHWTGYNPQNPGPVVPENTERTDSMPALYKNELVTLMKDAQAGVPLRLREVPTFWTGVVGDFDGNSIVGGRDIDLIRRESYQRAQGLARGYNWLLDLDSDGSIDGDDVTFLRAFILNACEADINLDGYVNNSDFDILQANFNTQVTDASGGWAIGDLNGDEVVDLADFIIL